MCFAPRHFWLLTTLVVGCTMPNPAYRPREPRDAAVVDTRPGESSPDGATPGDPPDGPPEVDQGLDQAGGEAFDQSSDQARDQASDVAQDRPAELPPLPPRRAVVETAAATPFSGAMGGAGQSLNCNANEVLVGYIVSAGVTDTGAPVVNGLRAQCGRLEVSVTDDTYRIQAPINRQLSTLGTGTASSLMALCGTDEALVGFFGRAGMRLDQVGFRCASFRADAAMTVTFVPGTSFPAVPTTSNENEFSRDCAPGTVAIGHLAFHGAWIDGLGLQCGRIRLVP